TYWDKNTNIYGSVFVQSLMSYVRFTEINTNLSLAKIHKSQPKEKRDIEKATTKIVSYYNNKFNELYIPNQEIAIVEGVCKYQGKFSFKTYMPAKFVKIEIKFYILANSKSSFVINF
ncbi:PiggyBac transposable element-derived protein 4, partial [Cucumispora dikerogammari]